MKQPSRQVKYRAARRAMDTATARLLVYAAQYRGPEAGVGQTAELLSAAREYGRALNRIESMRR